MASTETASFRVTQEEREILEGVALELGVSLSEMLRNAAFAVAREQLEKHSREDLRRRATEHKRKTAVRSSRL
jgi:uncharacterized protein (DUF1778 family)